MASNFSIGMIAVVVVVMLLQLYKIQSLGGDLQNQVINSEALKQALVKNLESCEQRTKECKTALKKEEQDKLFEISLQKSRESELKVVEEKLDNMRSEKQQIQDEKINVENHLQKFLAEAAVKDRERENAMKEVERYHGLYQKGNEIIDALRKENEKLKALTAKPVGQIVSEKGTNEVKARVERKAEDTANQETLPSLNALEKQTQGQDEAKEIEQKKAEKTEQAVKEEGELKENVNAEQKQTKEVKKEENEKEMKGVEENQVEMIETAEKKEDDTPMEKPMVLKEEEVKEEAAVQNEAKIEGKKGEVEEENQRDG